MATTTAKRDSMDATNENVKPLENKLETTHLTSSAPQQTRRPLNLTSLPASIRSKIYAYTLDTELVNVGLPPVSYTHSLPKSSSNSTSTALHFSASRSPFPVSTGLFYVNKQISEESLSYFYGKNLWVKFEIYTGDKRHAKSMLVDSGVLFVSTTGKGDGVGEEAVKRHAMDVVLVEKGSSAKAASVMFPAQYLPRLIHFLDSASRTTKTWAPVHTLFIDVLNTYDFGVARLQGDLLELFRLLSNFGGVEVSSSKNLLLPRYAEGLVANMTRGTWEAEGWLKSVTELADCADETREKGEYALANEYGQAVIIALTYGYLTHAEVLHSADEAFVKSVQRLRWRTELGIGIALSLMHRDITNDKNWLTPPTPTEEPTKRKDEVQTAARDLLLAETSISKALSLATDSPSPSSNPWFLSLPVELIPPNKPTWFSERERAQTWFALGTVHTALGEYLFGAGDLERALEMWGDGGEGRDKVEKAFEKARGGIDGDVENMWVGKIRPGTGLKRAGRLARGL